jgi:ABC-type cobalamin/Fe3+-siderophores transport system ATPase subunit
VITNAPIYVNPRYKTSARIDGVDDFVTFINDFILHGTAINTLETLSRSYAQSAQRTYTLTGPYGSGKSTLALFLSSLLSQDNTERELAHKKLESSAGVSQLVQNSFEVKKGWKVIKHVCGLTSPAQSILKSICEQINQKIDDTSIAELNDAQCLKQIREIFSRKTTKNDGFILLLDELGKALDFQSRAGADLYFFQELADIAQQSKNNVIVIGFLHQAFVEYAKNKDALTQKEWAKVQGRYIDFGFNPSIDESLILVGDSIQKKEPFALLLEGNHKALATLTASKFKGQATNKDILLKTLPLSPLVSLLLGPISRRRFSQNERSLFGFLASNEKYGFREFLANNYEVESTELAIYTPENLWDYLEHNLHHVIVTSADGKAWLEACDAIQRASQKGSELHVVITKIVALLTIFGFQHHLHASRQFITEYLQLCGIDIAEIKKAIIDLETWTVVIYRSNHDALFVFQGSDIDINSLLLATIETISNGVDWTTVCNTNIPVLATSHYHQTGTMRWANTLITEKYSSINNDVLNSSQLSGSAFATFVILAKKVEDEDLKTFSNSDSSIIVGMPANVEQLKVAAIELLALEHIKKHERQINHDLIAKNELETRIDDSKRNVSDYFHELLDDALWHYSGKPLKPKPLSAIASQIADEIFCETPIVLNELVNRSKPSGSANAAINKLMLLMLKNAGKEDLGFESDVFPPEKGIYLSCLKSKGWHLKTAEGYTFPYEWDNKAQVTQPKMFKLWQSGVALIKNSDSLITIDELYKHWMSPPFGLTSGLCRLYGLALLKSLEGQVAFYDKDSTNNLIFIPELDEVFVNKLHKHPHEAGVRYFEITGIQTDLIKKIAQATHSKADSDTTVLEIAKHIVQLVHKLPSWVKKTSGDSFIDGSKLGLTSEARAFRNEVLRANDPYKLILESLPSIFSLDNTKSDSKDVLVKKLKNAIEDLTSQHEMLTGGFKQIVIEQLGSEFDSSLKKRCANVVKASQRPSVKEFATRLVKYIDKKLGFEMVIATAAGAPERNWTDRHIRNALDEIQNLCVQFRRIESFSRFSDSAASKPVALVTKNEAGDHEEYEIHLSRSLANDGDVEGAIIQLEAVLNNMPIEKKRAALSQLLISNMEKVEDNKNATD